MATYLKYQRRGELQIYGGELISQDGSVFIFRDPYGTISTIDASDSTIEKFDCSSYHESATLADVIRHGFPKSTRKSTVFAIW